MHKPAIVDNDKRCSPMYDFENGSCIPIDLLVEMAKAYNKNNPNNRIPLKNKMHTLNPHKYKAYLIKEFSKKDRMGKICDNQRCWVKQSYVKDMNPSYREELTKNTFRPSGPQGKFEWLNTIHIQDVMSQYEKAYPEFTFLGAVPIDFDDLPNLGIKDLDFDSLKKEKKTKIGVVFNLDEHYKGGSHWVGMFADIKDGGVYFFDSYGVKPEPRIRKFMRRIARYCKKNGCKTVVDHNKVRHQYGGNACGVYSINFVIRMLNGESFEDIVNSKIPDKIMNMNRKVYFSNT